LIDSRCNSAQGLSTGDEIPDTLLARRVSRTSQ